MFCKKKGTKVIDDFLEDSILPLPYEIGLYFEDPSRMILFYSDLHVKRTFYLVQTSVIPSINDYRRMTGVVVTNMAIQFYSLVH